MASKTPIKIDIEHRLETKINKENNYDEI